MAKWLILQQTHAEGPGKITSWLEGLHQEPEIIELWHQELPPDCTQYAGLVIMGGPMGANDGRRFPFLEKEMALIREWVESGRPLLGICLGSQLMAKALGGTVFRGEQWEVGWLPIKFTAASCEDPVFKGCPEEFTVFQWHHDTFALPEGAVLLASSDFYENQAFRYGPKAYALQFHPEMTEELIHLWIDLNREDLIRKDPNLPQKIWMESKHYLGNLERFGQKIMQRLVELSEKD